MKVLHHIRSILNNQMYERKNVYRLACIYIYVYVYMNTTQYSPPPHGVQDKAHITSIDKLLHGHSNVFMLVNMRALTWKNGRRAWNTCDIS